MGAMSIIFWIMLSSYLLIHNGGQSSILNMMIVGAFFLIPYCLLVAMYYFVGFSLYHYFFQANSGFQPIRASILFVKSRWAVIFWGWVLSTLIYLSLNVSFWFLSYLEGIISAAIAIASSPGGIFNSLAQLADILIRGKLDMNSIPVLLNLGKAFFSTGIASFICSALKSFISITFWSHQFLYFMGFYHDETWTYPKDFISN